MISKADAIELHNRLLRASETLKSRRAGDEMYLAVLSVINDLSEVTTPNRTDPISHRIVYLDPADASYGDDPDRRHFC